VARRAIDVAVHTFREGAVRDLALGNARLVFARSHGANLFLFARHFFSSVLAVGRRVLDLGVQLGPNQNRQP
jgi:hypothetical protein